MIYASGSINKHKLVVASLLPSIGTTAKKHGWNLNRTLKAIDKVEVSDKSELSDKPEVLEQV